MGFAWTAFRKSKLMSATDHPSQGGLREMMTLALFSVICGKLSSNTFDDSFKGYAESATLPPSTVVY